ncbi:MAG TPA: metallophosphoesterase [Phycisphaerae bacterium]|nr:metallophosphoesterase [Phycisphaerae bacterium]
MRRGYALTCGGLVAVLALVAAAEGPAAQPLPRVEYGQGRELAKLADPAIGESSGLAVGRAIKGAFWTHNRAGDGPRVFAVNAKGETLVTVTVQGAEAADWSDMASFIAGGKSMLLVGDIGDKAAARKTCTVYVVREPRVYPGARNVTLAVGAEETIEFTYEDGPHDCESLAADSTNLTIYLAGRPAGGKECKVYSLAWPAKDKRGHRVDKGPYVAKVIATLKTPATTAMDISPDGLRCVVLADGAVCEYVRRPSETWAEGFARPGRALAIPQQPRAESLCYGPDGKTLFLTGKRTGKDPVSLLEVPIQAAPAGAQAATKPAGSQAALVTLTVYSTGDIHEHTANLARLAAYVKAAKEQDPNVLLIDAGDLCGGNGEREMAVTNGEGMWALMAAAEYDGGVLGNHDYNKGVARIAELCRKHPKFPLLMANADWTDDQKKRGLPELLPPYKIVKLQGLTVGIIGVGSHDMRYANLERFPVYFAPQAVKRLVPVLRKQVDIVIAVTHQYEDDDYWKTASGENSPDLIVGGHSHGAYAMPYGYGAVKPSFIVKAGPYIKGFGVVQFKWDGQKIVEKIGDVIHLDASWPEDPTVKALREKFFKQGDEKPKAVEPATK